MLIDPQGILHGERIGACSDEAKLHFPRLLAVSNGFGRIEMSVTKIQMTVYASFTAKPTREQLKGWFREYHENFLLFVYQAEDGSVWGQWDLPARLLPRHKTAPDKRSPAPDPEMVKAYMRAYVEAKRARYASEHDDLQNFPKISEDLGKFPRGVGVGVGVGKELAQPSAAPVHSPSTKPSKDEPHPLHSDCKQAILAYWSKYVQPGAEPTWDGSEAKALADLLKALPKLTIERFRAMLENRGRSDVNPCERPRKWIASLPNYELGPLDAFGKPQALAKGSRAAQPIIRAPNVAQTANTLQREVSERETIVREWRETRNRSPDVYEAEAPKWVKDILDAERAKVA